MWREGIEYFINSAWTTDEVDVDAVKNTEKSELTKELALEM